MSNGIHRLWLSQAHSDLAASDRVLITADGSTYCQAISKYQQAVEKTVKALGAALRSAGIMTLPNKYYYRHDVTEMAKAMSRPVVIGGRSVLPSIQNTLHSGAMQEITKLCSLAPARPQPGTLHSQNTEYPYEIRFGQWTYPASPSSFKWKDVERFQRFSKRLYYDCSRIIAALDRAP